MKTKTKDQNKMDAISVDVEKIRSITLRSMIVQALADSNIGLADGKLTLDAKLSKAFHNNMKPEDLAWLRRKFTRLANARRGKLRRYLRKHNRRQQRWK